MEWNHKGSVTVRETETEGCFCFCFVDDGIDRELIELFMISSLITWVTKASSRLHIVVPCGDVKNA